MSKATDRLLTVSMLILLVTVLGAVQGGASAGSGKWSFLPYCLLSPCSSPASSGEPTYHTTMTRTSTVHTTQTKHSSSSQTRTTTTTTIKHTTSSYSATVVVNGPAGPSFGITGWYVWVPAILIVGAAIAFILIRRQTPKILDLKGALGELENQRRYFSGSWSMKMRNAALLKYYLLMEQICCRVGIVDRAEETPHQFIGRAALELDVNDADAEKFADVVDRAHYGAELSQDEVVAASRFMDSFTRVLTGKVNLG